MAKMTTLEQLPNVLDEMLAEFQQEAYETRQKAIQAGAEVLKSALEADSQTYADTGEYARSWEIKRPYPDHRYVGNTKTAKGVVHRKKFDEDGNRTKGGEAREGVPLSNVLEYAENSPHAGRIRRCFDSNESKIYEAMVKEIINGGN